MLALLSDTKASADLTQEEAVNMLVWSTLPSTLLEIHCHEDTLVPA